MVQGLELLADKEYLGRMILMGVDPSGQYDVVAYALTGRSPPSRARRLVLEGNQKGSVVKIEVTDPELLEQGDPALLIYNAMTEVNDYHRKGIIVSNGAQTDLVLEKWGQECYANPAGVLERAFWKPYMKKYKKKDGTDFEIDIASFEPDAPNNTPRITGLLKAGFDPVLAILRRGEIGDIPELELHRVRVDPGYGKFLSTYTGQNVPTGVKIPSFTGAPWTLQLDYKNPEDLAQDLFDVLGPKTGPQYVSPGDDFRVSVVTAFRNKADGTTTYHRKNMN